MTRLAILDHASHTLFVEDVNETLLEQKYNGEEEAYIKDNYDISNFFSWDYIVSTQYIPDATDGDVYDVDFTDIAD